MEVDFPWEREKAWMQFEEELREKNPKILVELFQQVRTAFDACWKDGPKQIQLQLEITQANTNDPSTFANRIGADVAKRLTEIYKRWVNEYWIQVTMEVLNREIRIHELEAGRR
jgi:hypothetical protein